MNEELLVRKLYQQFITFWNTRNASGLAACFSPTGNLVGFDGSQVDGSAAIEKEISGIFSNHKTAPFVYIIRELRFLSADTVLLRAVAGMVPENQTVVNPAVNAVQSLVAVKKEDKWQIELFQNTPAAWHGRQDMVEQLTKELNEAYNQKTN